MPGTPQVPESQSARRLRLIGTQSPLIICQLLPAEQFLIWALRAWAHQSHWLDMGAQALRWKLRESFLMFGIADQQRQFEQAAHSMITSLSRDVDFHGLGCVCVGDDERRWLNALSAIQRDAHDEAARALAHFTAETGVKAALDLFAPLTQALLAVGWVLPPWEEIAAGEAASPAPVQVDARPEPQALNAPPRLRLVHTRAEDRPAPG